MQRIALAFGTASVALAVLASPSSSRADSQSPPIPDVRTTSIRINIDTLFDSNTAQSSRELAAGRGLSLADESILPAGEFTLSRPIGRLSLLLTGAGGYDFHRVNTIRNSAHFNFAAGGALTTGRCRETVVGDYNQTQTALSLLTVGVLNNTQDTRSIDTSVSCGRSIGFFPKLQFTQSWSSNTSPDYKSVDNRSSTLNASVGYQRPAFGVASAYGVFEQATYPNRLTLGPNGLLSYGYKLYAGGFRYEHLVGSRFNIVASVSYTSLNPETSVAQKFSGFTYSADATYRMTQRLSTHISVARKTSPSTRPDANFSIENSILADASYRLGARLTLGLSGDRTQISYVGPTVAQSRGVTDQTAYNIGATAAYALTRNISLSLKASDTEFQANFPGFGYSSTKVTLGAQAAF